MSSRREPIKGVTAGELMAKLAHDEDYQRTKEADDAQRQARVQELHDAERPIVADLRRAGVDVDSVWDLVNTSAPYPNALPVLVKHLELGGVSRPGAGKPRSSTRSRAGGICLGYVASALPHGRGAR